MTLRRLIVILCIAAILPTTVAPTCVRYFIYSEIDWSGTSQEVVYVDGSDRQVEVLAASRVPSHVTIEPLAIVDLDATLFVEAHRISSPQRVEDPPAFLADTRHRTFLRNAVLRI